MIRFIGPMYRAVSRRAPSIDFSSRGCARKRGRETKTFFAIENEATIRVYPWNEEEEGGWPIPSSGFRPPPELTDSASNNLLIGLAALDENYK